MKLGLYPGCSLEGTAREYNESVVALAQFCGLDLPQVTDWNCCGATAAHNLNKDLSLALPARILALAERDGFDKIVVPCAACYCRLSVTRHELKENPALREKISGIIEMKLDCGTEVLNVLQMIDRFIVPKIEGKVSAPFGYKVACYYGCLLVRPHKILGFDRVEDPQTMDELMKKIGAEPIAWPSKVECCGAGLSVSRTDVVVKLSGKIVADAVQRGAEAIVVACPMCHSNLDMRRAEIEARAGREYPIPVVYVTQAFGVALGIQQEKLGFNRHLVPVKFGPPRIQGQVSAPAAN